MNIKEKVKRLNFLINKSTANAILTEDIYALQLINGLITQGNYLRFIALMHTSTDNYANQIFSIRSNQYLDNHKLFFLVL